MRRDADRPTVEVALADALCGAADDLGVPLRRPTAERLAAHVLEDLAVSGYRLIRDDP